MDTYTTVIIAGLVALLGLSFSFHWMAHQRFIELQVRVELLGMAMATLIQKSGLLERESGQEPSRTES